MTNFNDSRVLVVGGSSGIGLETARAFARAGARVTIASRSRSKLDHALDAAGIDMEGRCLDSTDDAAVEKFFASSGDWDHIVVTAAETAMGPVRALDLHLAQAAMNSKFWGSYRIARRAQIRPNGSLTLISGYLSARPRKNAVLQGAINAAVDALARGLALELAPIRVNSVSPGLVATPLWSDMASAQREQMYEAAADRLPAGRIGTPEDIARAVLYLAASGYATGSTVVVDGGGTIAV
jgi:NAD(P)-dependent dehydrogenase (short-subunit alcohol dehydrogenase family)